MKVLSRYFPLSWRDTGVSCLVLAAAVGLCALLLQIDSSGGFASMVFVLAVVCISRFTDGYFYGVAASFVGVAFTNYIFTYPYWSLNFTIAGYPLTFISMFSVSLITSTLTTRTKEHERLRIEAEKEKMRGNLLRAISHDIRTPLTSIMGSTSAILDAGDKLSEENKRELIKQVHEESRWLLNMVENLLSITRMNNEKALISKQPEVVEEVVGGAVQKFRKRYAHVKITIVPPERFAVVSMDATLIEQVLLNIMENAVIHGKNTTEIRVTFDQTVEQVAIIIGDNGGGVEPKLLPHILEDSFQNIREKQTDTKRNMGIGLSVCRSIIAAHGGTIHVRNTDAGAEFSIYLPLEQEECYDV